MPGRRKKKSFRDVAKQGATHFEVSYKRPEQDPAELQQDEDAKEQRWDEQMKYGVYYHDEYDYLQHLREVKDIRESEMKELPTFQLKDKEMDDESVFSIASESAAAAAAAEPEEELDPEITAALDDEFDFEDPENVLDDDFMQMANGEAGMQIVEEEEDFEDDDEETDDADEPGEDDPQDEGETDKKTKDLTKWLYQMQLQRQGEGGEEGSDSEFDDEEEGEEYEGSDSDWTDCSEDTQEGMPRVSKYSAASMPRNENLRLIDQMTQALLEREYSWDKTGALDGEEVGGRVKFDSDLFRQAQKDLLMTDRKVTMKEMFNSEERVRPVLPESWHYVEEKDFSKEEKINYHGEPLVVKKKPEFDAQSILSTYSRTKNLPTKIVIPEDWMPKKKQKKKKKKNTPSDTASMEEEEEEDKEEKEMSMDMKQWWIEQRADAAPTFRPKDETKEERKERKQAVKTERKERRALKKQSRVSHQMNDQRSRKVDEERSAQQKVVSWK